MSDTTTDRAGLVRELEGVEEGSREMDGKIHEALGKCPHWETEYFAVQDDTGFQCKSCKESYVHTLGRDVPHYSASLDAKLPWENIVYVRQCGKSLWYAVHEEYKPTHRKIEGRAKTEPLARRIAALRAKPEELG